MGLKNKEFLKKYNLMIGERLFDDLWKGKISFYITMIQRF